MLAVRQETGSFAVAGAAAGGFAAAVGLSAPLLGRLTDREGPRRAMPPLAALHAAGLVMFVAVLPAAPAWLMVTIAAVAGAALPPLSPAMRAMWQRLLGDDELVATAFALDAAVVEGVFIVGPLLVGLALAVATAQAALLASAAVSVLGVLAVCASPAVREWETERHEARALFAALGSPGLLTVFLATIPLGLSLGAVEIALPAFAAAEGRPGRAGLLISMWGAGSLLGALAYGARGWRRDLAGRWLALNALLAVGTLLPLLATSTALMLVLLVPCGAAVAPSLASGGQLMGLLSPPGMTTEAYAWGPTALVGGVAAGNAVAGALVEAGGWRAAIAFAAAAAAAAAAVGRARRRSLELAPAVG